MSPTIRAEQESDLPGIREVNLAAFPDAAEANLVEELRQNSKATLSLVAVSGEHVLGHILFSPVTMASNDGSCRVLGLGPMAVLTKWQGRGIGSQPVLAGLDHCKESGVGCVVVLGQPAIGPARMPTAAIASTAFTRISMVEWTHPNMEPPCLASSR